MLSALESIIEIIGYVPEYIVYAIETVFNLFSSAIGAIFAAATSLIELPGVPSPPDFIEAINWFFPVGAVIAIMVPIVTGYVTFLAVRWIYAKVGDL